MSNVFIFTNGGTKSQRQLTEDITAWFINAKLPRFKNFTIEIDLEKLNDDFKVFVQRLMIEYFMCRLKKDYEMMTF